MTSIEIVAYIGALAWLPHILGWAYREVVKPQIRVSCALTAEVGYSTLGPIVNINLAISTERRDALIEKITLALIHEKGEKRTLVWQTLNEHEQEFRTAEGQTSQWTRSQPATALKVGQFFLAEKRVGFQDLEFLNQWKQLESKLIEHYRHLKNTKNPDPFEAVLQSKEYSALLAFFRDYIYWKAGRYTFEFVLEEAHLKTPHKETFQMVLSQLDVTSLKGNVELGEQWVRAIFAAMEERTDVVAPKIWYWAYPEIRRSQ